MFAWNQIEQQIERLDEMQDDLKDTKKDAKTNYQISNLIAQMDPTKDNKKQEQNAKQTVKDIKNAIGDVKDVTKDLENFEVGAKSLERSEKLADRFEKFLKKGKIKKAERLLGRVEGNKNLDITPYLSPNFEKLAGKAGIDLSMDFSMPQDQLIAQADLTNPQRNFVEALTNPGKFLQDVKGLVDTLNEKTFQKEQMIEDLLRRNTNQENQSSSEAFGTLLANVDINNDPSTWPTIKDADSLKEIPVKFDEDMNLFAPQILPLETAMSGINFNYSFT